MLRGFKLGKVFLLSFLILLTAIFLTTSCTSKPSANTPTDKKVTVKVNVSLPSEKTSTKTNAFTDNITKVTLTVKDSSGNPVQSTETTNKLNPSFEIQLTPGTYTFEVKGYENDTEIFSGAKENQTVAQGNDNTIVIDATFVNGTIKATVEIEQAIWDKYNVTSAKLTYKKDVETQSQEDNITFSSTSTVLTKSVYPGMWNVKFNISLAAKSQYTEPASKDLEKSISIEVSPAKIREIKFKVYFDSQTNEPQVAVVVTQINLPYIQGVTNLTATWVKNANKLILSWDYNDDAQFYIYKEIVTQDNETYYELVGNTQDKNYTIENFDQSEYDRISGIAINTYKDGKESGLVVLKKDQIQEFTIGAVTNLKGYYDGAQLKLTWDHNSLVDKYIIYRKLPTDSDFVKVAEVTEKQATIELSLVDYNNLEKIAVSVYCFETEGQKVELAKADILPFDGGTGTQDDPYLIRTAWQLQRLNDSQYLTANKYFKLIANIDLTGFTWTPIGNFSSDLSQTAFQGTLDGDYHKITNLTFNDTSRSNAGLFGYLYNATVKNLIIENANVTAKQYVGALSGSAKKSMIYRVGVRNSAVEGTNNNYNIYAGGLIGDVSGGVTIEESFANNITVSGPNYDNARVGGLVGRLMHSTDGDNNVSKSYATGTVKFKSKDSSNIGGLIGLTSSGTSSTAKNYINQSYAAVAPSNIANDGTNAYWKGFVGGSVVAEDPTIKNYFDTEVSATPSGSSKATLQDGLTTAQMKSSSNFVGWDFTNVWTINEGNDYPRLKWEQDVK
ncbi:DUF4493 domain-containing protein [Fervidobacterium sp. 2310opik-2]|uniref:DUF4493 domain-containing protein n=1 Tax=Fervidobacterium sp. 2310opik-2 TaxID=1755815 RepID=UPI0013DFC748|nr:DUF4493 domain-containing protein [Fervidobacterium sp. 2310opik-2]KAF2962244.1 hypothetical protein AS161_04685 [Fervidobacterium sp. 2310opik-2]